MTLDAPPAPVREADTTPAGPVDAPDGSDALATGWRRPGLMLSTGLRGGASWLGNLLFPPVCAGCRRHVSRPGALCGRCWRGLNFLERPWCAVMGTPFTHDMGDGILSAEAIADPPPFDHSRAAVAYTGVARQIVQGLKFRDRADLAMPMAEWMLRAGDDLVAEADLLVPVPLHWRRFLGRRFNQSAELARALSGLTGKRFSATALARVKNTARQVGLGARERENNVRAAFRVPVEREIEVTGRRIVLIDDVYTTGATAFAATKALKRAGAASVDVLTFARVLPGDFRADETDII